MKREEKNVMARQRILDAAMQEFSAKGYTGASLNTACAENNISKGIIYHHFKDKNELYLLCVEKCFNSLTAHLSALGPLQDQTTEGLHRYFDARLSFFAENPLCLGIFADAAFRPPVGLAAEIAARRRRFDELNISILTSLLESKPLRSGLSVAAIVEDFRSYMDFFNLRFQTAVSEGSSPASILKEHEERCHRQIDILLHGVLGEANET